MPPFGAQGAEAGLAHYPSQQTAVIVSLARQFSLPQKFVFLVDMCKARHVVYARAHGYAVAVRTP